MTDERVQQLIAKIKQNMVDIHDADRRTQNRIYAENFAIQQALATEYGARRGLRYVNRTPVDYAVGIVTIDEILRPEAIIRGSQFNMKALRESKVWAYSRHEVYGFNSRYVDHPYFYRDHRSRAAAIAAHLYGVPDDIQTWAASNGLMVEVDAFPSWWNPGGTTAVIYTRHNNAPR